MDRTDELTGRSPARVPIISGSLVGASKGAQADARGSPGPSWRPFCSASSSRIHSRTWFQLGRPWFTTLPSRSQRFAGRCRQLRALRTVPNGPFHRNVDPWVGAPRPYYRGAWAMARPHRPDPACQPVDSPKIRQTASECIAGVLTPAWVPARQSSIWPCRRGCCLFSAATTASRNTRIRGFRRRSGCTSTHTSIPGSGSERRVNMGSA